MAAGDVTVGAGAWTAVHHAFTAPQDLERSTTIPASALAYAYDIVCNGNEIWRRLDPYPSAGHSGAGVRRHGPAEGGSARKFGFLLDAFNYGPPPHGGIAFGWDRICALLSGSDSIRDVIAFPKSGGGVDPLTDAPAPITAEQRKEAGIDVQPEI